MKTLPLLTTDRRPVRRLIPRLPRLPRVIAATSAVAALALAGCSSVEPNNAATSDSAGSDANGDSFGSPANAADITPGGELVMALSAEPDQLDPALSRSLYSRYVFNAMCQKLYDVDQDAKIVPQLATGLPTTSADGLTVTIPVRDDITFADGTPFNADAVKATLERNLTIEGTGRKSELGPIASVRATDSKTVAITLSKPFAPLTAALTDRAGMIVSPKAAAALGTKFATAPVCVGPFKFAKRVPQNSIELVKDPTFYDAAKVHYDKITYRIITDASIRAANLRSGDVKVADSLSTQDIAALRQDSALEILQSQSLGYQGVTFNVGNRDGIEAPPAPRDTPEAKDPRIRRAFDLSIDRAQLVKVIFNDLNTVACSAISPSSEFSSEAAQACPKHDPAAAQALLKEAGVSTPFPIDMITSNNPDSLRLAQAIQSMVKEGGFDLKIQPVEYASLLDQQDRGDFALLQLGWSGRIDPDANLTNFVGTGGSQNVAGYSNKDVDDLLTQARESTDLEARKGLYGQVVAKLQQDDPLIYLYRQRNLTGVSTSVKGVQVFPDGVVRLAFAGAAK